MDEHQVEMGALRDTPLLGGLGEEDLGTVARMGQHEHFESDQNIVEQGDPGDGMYIILAGRAQVDVGGRYHDMGPGEFFGEMALIRGRKRSATVKAVEPVAALKIPAEAFRTFLLEHPSVAVAMLEGVVDRLSEVQERVEAWMA
jgi:CRP-like cAMP-binding protein